MLEKWMVSVAGHVRAFAEGMFREPSGILRRPYVVPAGPDSPSYSDELWDWDSWIVSVVLGQVELDTNTPGRFLEYETGSVENFLEHADPDGVVPIQLSPRGPLLHGDPSRAGGFSENMHKPVLAQHIAHLVQRHGNVDWAREQLPGVEAFLERYRESHMHPELGLAYWQTDFAIGVDNDPAAYYRPHGSTASIFLNSLLYREFLAFGYLQEVAGNMPEAVVWRGLATDLADAVDEHCWDERDGTFYSVDVNLRDVDPNDWLHQGAPRSWAGLLLRVDGWSSFLPLWAGLASPDQAASMVDRLLDRATFMANHGIRTLSRMEKQYNLRASGNPSNWLGPVWGISNYLIFRGLWKYGYLDEARDIAEKTVRLFGMDLQRNGTLHEFYNPDTGEPIMTRNFQNWNFLVLQMIAFLEGRPIVTEF